jgi:hypothetical protein
MMRSAAGRLAVAIAAAYSFGWATGRLPAPSDPREFWISNIGGPYLVIGFIAGAWVSRRAAIAVIAGSTCATATVCGFYNFAMIGWDARARWELDPSTPWWAAAAHAYQRWLPLMLWGRFPWLTIAVVVGLASGYLGHRWAVRGVRAGAALVGTVLIVEPVLYATGLNTHLRLGPDYTLGAHNAVIWSVEALIGVAAVVASRRWTPVGPQPPRASSDPIDSETTINRGDNRSS